MPYLQFTTKDGKQVELSGNSAADFDKGMFYLWRRNTERDTRARKSL